MKQSGRSFLPEVRNLTTLDEIKTQCGRFDLKVIAHEKKDDAADVQPVFSAQRHSVLILIGPEGGFSDEEFTSFLRKGFHHLHFGNRRLRTETAAILAAGFALSNPP
jgi:16S rRNA (uracil1498-N3)-methyltransferase